MLKNILIFVLCLAVSGCATLRQLPTTADEIQTVEFSPDKTYIIHMDNGYIGRSRGDKIAVDRTYIHIKNDDGIVQSSIPIAHVTKFEEEKVKVATSIIVAGSIALVGIFTLGLIGLAKAQK
jgi:hypothetical protein